MPVGMPTRRARAKPPGMVATIDEAEPLVEATADDKKPKPAPTRRAPPRAASMGSYAVPRGVLRRGGSKLAQASESSGSSIPPISENSTENHHGGILKLHKIQNGQKKKLTWNHKVQKKRHPRLCDMTPEEIESVWYTENDSKIILAIAKVTVKMMMKGEPCDDFDYCSRGLEGKTPEGAKRRQMNKAKVRRSLLEEQDMQRAEGTMDDVLLAQTSIKNSTPHMQQAHQQGLKDEAEIADYKNEPLDLPPPQPAKSVRSGSGSTHEPRSRRKRREKK